MNKRKIFSLALTMALGVGLVACGNKNEAPQDQTSEVNSVENTESQKENTSAAGLKDGTYEVNETGHNGPIDFTIEIKDGKIAAIDVVNSYETPGVSTKALETDLPEKVIETQSIGVDAINGATISSRALLSAVKKSIEEAGGNPDDYMIAEEKKDPEEIEKEADVVIVGGGGAGLAAAVEAADAGASVAIIEKSGYVGGNTLISGGIYNTNDAKLQEKEEMTPGLTALIEEALEEEPKDEEHAQLQEDLRADYEAWKENGSKGIYDSKYWFALQTWNGGDKVANLDLVKELTYKAEEGLDWLHDLGWNYRDNVTAGAGSLYPRTHSVDEPLGTGYIKAYMDKLDKDENVEITYNTRANKLIEEDGKIVGVVAEDTDGNTYTFKANRGVILTTGGFAGNKDLINEYNTSGKWSDLSEVKSSNLPAITGDGIEMAKEVGADLVDMDQIQLLYLGNLNVSSITKGTFQPKGAEGLIYVNKDGKRFVKEDGRRDEISLAFLEQEDQIGYTVECLDSGVDYEKSTDLGGVPIKALIEDGTVFYGETLEEAANAAGINAENLQKTVDEFNQIVDENKAHDEFGRSVFGTKLENGPWYIIPKTPAIHHTMGGLKIDEDCHVINGDGEIIDGLFAAGEVVGGIHGANRLGGNALVDTVVFGRTAGQSIMK